MALALVIFCNLTHRLIQNVSASVCAIYLDLDQETPHLEAALLRINGRHLGKDGLFKFSKSHSAEDLLLLSPHIPEWLNLVNTVCWKEAWTHKELRSTDHPCASSVDLVLVLVPASSACITIRG
jgi:hypothetical protein